MIEGVVLGRLGILHNNLPHVFCKSFQLRPVLNHQDPEVMWINDVGDADFNIATLRRYNF